MAVVLVTSDLFFGSRVESAARTLAFDFTTCSSCAAAAAFCQEGTPHVVIIDLTMPGLQLAEDVAQFVALPHRPRIVAFGPHVHDQLLTAAAAAGCDEVLTRGQFDQQLNRLLRKWHSPEGDG